MLGLSSKCITNNIFIFYFVFFWDFDTKFYLIFNLKKWSTCGRYNPRNYIIFRIKYDCNKKITFEDPLFADAYKMGGVFSNILAR